MPNTTHARRRSASVHLRRTDFEKLTALCDAYGLSRPELLRIALERFDQAPPTPEELEASQPANLLRSIAPRRPVGSNAERMVADPTPEEIEERCEEIQAEWTPEERTTRIYGKGRQSKRRQAQESGWTVPEVKHRAG